jgi:mono/diheme cytochrome c family protein
MHRLRFLAALLLAGCGNGAAADGGYVHDTEAQLRAPYPDSIVAEGTVLRRALIARGDSIYQGQLALGTCSMCHGNDGRGGAVARDLTDNVWHHTDGTLERIRGVVAGGLVDISPAMPPYGGTWLSEDDVLAVSAYVFWLNRRHGQRLRVVRPGEAGAGALEDVPAVEGQAPEGGMQNGA